MRKSASGFVLVELMLVVSIIGLLASLSMPILSTMLETARHRQCDTFRKVVEDAESDYNLSNQGQSNLNITSLYSSGYLNQNYQCSSGGRYVWVSPNTEHSEYPMLGCSLHFWPKEEFFKSKEGKKEWRKQNQWEKQQKKKERQQKKKEEQAKKKQAKKG